MPPPVGLSPMGSAMLHNSSLKTEWKLHIYRVRDASRQQRILAAFIEIARPGVVALGTQSGPDHFVIVESCSLMNQVYARRVVMTIDPLATRTYECEADPEEARTRHP